MSTSHFKDLFNHLIDIDNKLRLIQLEEALFQGTVDYICKVAKTEAEICKLVEDGFDPVCKFQGSQVFRKRK